MDAREMNTAQRLRAIRRTAFRMNAGNASTLLAEFRKLIEAEEQARAASGVAREDVAATSIDRKERTGRTRSVA